MVLIIIFEPAIDQSERVFRIRQRRHANVVALARVHVGFRQAIALRALQRGEARAQTKLPGEEACVLRRLGRTVVGENLDRVCAWQSPKRLSTASSIMSRMSDPLMPTFTTTRQAMTARSCASMMKAPRTTSPFQHVNSKPSEHQHRFERMTATICDDFNFRHEHVLKASRL